MEAYIRKAGPNSIGARWCLAWQSSAMAAPAFYYYATRRAAVAALARIGEGAKGLPAPPIGQPMARKPARVKGR